MTAPIAPGSLGGVLVPRDPSSRMGFRYGVVFVITVTLVVFQIVAPGTAWSRAISVGLELLALTVVVATTRERASVRRSRAIGVAVAGSALLVAVAADALDREVVFVVGGVLALVVPAALIGGVVRLIREQGVTLHAIAGALTIYLYVGLLFAWAIAFAATVGDQRYFAQSGVRHGDYVYFSFTVLTTTGFGDYTAATRVGHALAVVEMLIGQLYLVTVIGVLVGNLVGRRRD